MNPAPYRPTPDKIPEDALAPREAPKRQKGYLTIGLAIALAVALLGLAAAAKWAQHEAGKRAEVEGRFTAFKSGVEEKGKQAQKEADEQKAKDRKRQEEANAENKRTIADLHARVARMRASGNNTSGGSVSASPAGSRCPESQACFDRAEYQRADGAFVAGARGLADEGSAVAVDLETARTWTQSR